MPLALALLITLYGALLRLDAFVGKYGALDRPGWARVVTHRIAPVGASLRPSAIVWKREAQPYVGGDPVNYLRFAREMRGFYDAHVREPVFLAVTRAWLWALDDQDVAVGFASLTGSVLVIFATYLVGATVVSPLGGVLAAAFVAIEHELITWAPDGWRDDTFTAIVILAAWSLIRLYRRPSTRHALIAGGLCGLACLTRITALSFVVPGLLWLVATRPSGAATTEPRPDWRRRIKYPGVAAGMCAVVLGPYLINCAVATGDPLYAINYHTAYYLHAEGRATAEPVSAAGYAASKFVQRPVGTLDTAFEGIFLQPFIEKWRGFAPWFSALDDLLRAAALIGLWSCAFFGAGRLLLVLLLSSLIPYMLTWNIGGGNEWRFTMHAYPFYVVAAALVIVSTTQLRKWWAVGRTGLRRPDAVRLWRRVAVTLGVLGIGTLAYFGLPWFVAREAIALGDSTSIPLGRRDRVFYGAGWSPPRRDGLVVRYSGARSTMRLPLSAGRDYELVLRMDPVDPATQRRVSVLLNGHLIGRPGLTWDAERVGSYRVPVRGDMVKGTSELTIIPESLVPAGSAGPKLSWLNPTTQVGVRLWYVRVLPLP